MKQNHRCFLSSLIIGTVILSIIASVVPIQASESTASRTASGKIYFDPFTSDTTAHYQGYPGTYPDGSSPTWTISAHSGVFSGEGSMEVRIGDPWLPTNQAPPDGGGQCYARVVYNTQVDRGVVALAYVRARPLQYSLC